MGCLKKVLVIFFIFNSLQSSAQNLLSNPGFENYSSLPTAFGEYNLAIGWENCSGGGTPEYFNTGGSVGTYFGTNLPHTGAGMGGFCPYHGSIMNFREYLSTALSSPMVAGQTYSVSFWLASGINGSYGFGCNNVGVCFSTGPLIQSGTLPVSVIPQVEITTIFYNTAWTQFSFQFTAASAFDYFTIGNFRDDSNTLIAQFGIAYDAVYYFLDDIDVELGNQPPVAQFNAPHHICPGTCTDFINLSQNATSYLWSFPGATPSTSTDINPASICYNSPGSYTVSLIATNATTSDTLTLNNYITVYPYPPPQGILQSGDTLFANQGAVSYQWYLNGVIIPGTTNYYHVALQSGDYNVVCTDANGCEVEAVIFSVVASMGNEISSGNTGIYPNPVRGKCTIHNAGFTMDAMVKISVFNIIGEKIYSDDNCRPASDGQLVVDCRTLPPGLYCLEATTDEKIIRKQFIKN